MVISDGNELQYELPVPSKIKPTHFYYKYVISKSKLGQLIGWTEQELEKLISNKIIKKI